MFKNDILLKGKHATYAKMLCLTSEKKDLSSDRKPANVFSRIIDIYMVAPVIGLVYGLKRAEDKESKDSVRIFADAVIGEQKNLECIFQMAMLVDDSSLSADEKINRAFRSEEEKKRFELFNSYVRGGIEWLYEQFTTGTTTHDEYIAKINEIVSSFKEEHDL